MRTILVLLDRYARFALPLGALIGILLPDLASMLRPALIAAVIGTLTGALLRLDPAALRDALARPRLQAALVVWQLVLTPLAVWLLTTLLQVPADLRLVLMLQACAPPIGSALVFAMILGLDGALAIVGTVAATLLLPLTLTASVALMMSGAGIEVDLLAFFVRVLLLVAAPFALAAALRGVLGRQRLGRFSAEIGGLNVVLMTLFVIAVMEGVTERLLADPATIGMLLGAAFAFAIVMHLASYLVFARAGARSAFVAALLGGNRNVGLMLVLTSGTAGPLFSLYTGVAQLPMYCAPLLLAPLVRRACAIQRA